MSINRELLVLSKLDFIGEAQTRRAGEDKLPIPLRLTIPVSRTPTECRALDERY